MEDANIPEQKSQNYFGSIFSFKNIIIYLIVAVVVYGGVYYFYKKNKGDYNNNTVPAVMEELPAATVSASQLSIKLSAQNNSAQDGIAILTEENGKTKVTITLSSPNSTPEPAHIHGGTCAAPGDVVFPLTNVVNGGSETVIGTTIANLEASAPLIINVHKSAAESKTYVACGDIS